MSKANSGKNHPMYGKHLLEEHKNKISKANSGKHLSEETRKKISESEKGKEVSEETKKKMSEVNKGKNNPNAKSVICITTGRIFYTVKEGAKYYGLATSGDICKCCRCKRKSVGKYKGEKLVWRYLVWNHNKKYRIKNK